MRPIRLSWCVPAALQVTFLWQWRGGAGIMAAKRTSDAQPHVCPLQPQNRSRDFAFRLKKDGIVRRLKR